MNRRWTAALAFLLMFAAGFFLGGWFLMPYLPPRSNPPVSAFEWAYWRSNWAGAALGILLGRVAAGWMLRGRRAKQDRA